MVTFELFIPPWGSVVALALAFLIVWLWFVALLEEFL